MQSYSLHEENTRELDFCSYAVDVPTMTLLVNGSSEQHSINCLCSMLSSILNH